ncbi:unnamed protein product [Protopolystoma xenopodis]|uniref:Uncharacterized protein n=1 Tax=Protopolystoma xenopodis TaxID=117903 RepID=A0A3S5CKN0_9PLAT|nr:unnamed protein product [Protopolystoma xenopodis]
MHACHATMQTSDAVVVMPLMARSQSRTWCLPRIRIGQRRGRCELHDFVTWAWCESVDLWFSLVPLKEDS